MEETEKKKLSKSRKIRIIVAVSVVAVVVLSAIIGLIVYASNVVGFDDSYEFAVAEGCSDFYYGNLSENQKKLYRMMYKEAEEALHSKKNIDTLGLYRYSDYKLSREEAISVWYALRYDAPSLFIVSNSYVPLPDSIALMVAKEFSSKEVRQKVFESLESSVEQVKQLLDGIDDEALKFKIIYDYVMGRTFYQTDEDYNNVYDGYTCSIVGVLDGDDSTGSICQGYAQTVSYLCNIFGIDCVYVGSENVEHALNIVYIKDKWYYADANTEDRLDDVGYKYFLNGRDKFWSEIIAVSGNASRDFLINCLPQLESHSYGEYGFWVSDGTLTYRILNRDNCKVDGCDSEARSVVIPSSFGGMTVRIGSGSVFSHCDSLEGLTVEDNSEIYKSEGNCIIDKSTNMLIAGCKSSVIPNYVTAIGSGAFYNCNNLTNLTIPESVTSIGDRAFYYCKGMQNIFIPRAVMVMGRSVFEGCDKLTICCQASERPDGWDEYWKYGQLVIWSSLGAGTTDSGIIWSLTIDEEIIISGYVGESNQVEIPSKINGYDVTRIKQGAFYDCNDLISIYIPIEVAVLESNAFGNIGKLAVYCQASQQPDGWDHTWNYLSSRPVIFNCDKEYGVTDEGLKWCLISDNTVTISGYVGTDTKISLPSAINGRRVTRIARYAFNNLKNIVSVEIPKSMLYIDDHAFVNCDNLTIYCEAADKPSGWEYNWNFDRRPVAWNINEYGITDSGIQWSLDSDGNLVITGCIGGKYNVEIPSEINGHKVTGIGNDVFRNNNTLTSIIIPSEVTTIPDWVFSGCSCLTIYCEAESQPDGWSRYWHSYCPVVWDCRNNDIADDGYIYFVADDGIRYAVKDGEAIVAKQSESTSGEVVILDSVMFKGIKYRVTAIGANAFSYCEGLSGIEIPNSVKAIGKYAFYDCRYLKSIVIPKSVTEIKENAFAGCHDLSIIYCEAQSKPSGWDENWNRCYVDYETEKSFYISVTWNYEIK